MKVTTMSIIVMFLASALVLPVGMSYAQTNVTAVAPTFQTITNSAGGNHTMYHHGNYTGMYPGMNHTGMMYQSMNHTGMMSPGMNHTMSMPMTNAPAPKMMAPLEEVKSGVAPKSVTCEQGFSLILKAEDGSAACVDSSVAQVLVQRGWAVHS
ncbi:hypothetical protein [Candidatus Nitrosotalea bavarica]|uniref:hypothetical protein n=1 Tax=Candidatus Nitrosotalea bavarica TaxID=1903277 RepID=UPI0013FE196C|nr:hypothetical protein [Candidatus Nitrosotalea bavarica]